MYLKLKNNNFVLIQPTGYFLSYFFEGERMLLEINDSAKEILSCLNGTKTEADIVKLISKKYKEKYSIVQEFVQSFLEDLSVNNLLEGINEVEKVDIIRGSEKYYTPDFVTLDLTHNCPLNCTHCFANAGIGDSMPVEDCLSLVGELLEMGVTTFQLTGGEPFSYPEIKEILNVLIGHEVSIRIATSGYIFNKKIMELLSFLSKYSDIQFQVSIDGMERTHNQIRKKRDSYGQAINFICYCIEHDIKVTVATSLINQSLDELIRLSKVLKQLGVSQQRFGLITDQGRALENKIERWNYSEFLAVIAYLKKLFEKDEFIIEEIENKKASLLGCGAGYKTIKITPALMVTPCALMSLTIGNLKVETLKSVFKRSTKTFMKLQFPDTTICGECIHKEYCNGCISEAVIRKDNVSKCAWYNQEKYLLNMEK